LESFSQLNTSRVDSREINENMYLVVRSLKNNNQKIVSYRAFALYSIEFAFISKINPDAKLYLL
jgi:hypothetical protein